MSQKLSTVEIKKRLQKFVKQFATASNEQQEAVIFWTRFYECFGIDAAAATLYEKAVHKLDGAKGRIDSFIPGKLLVEHKSKGKDLDIAFEQALGYALNLSDAEKPKYIVVSDFARVRLYDLAANTQHECTLAELPNHVAWFRFLLDDTKQLIVEETPINRNAAYAISKLHQSLLDANFKGRDLEIFLTRLLFCLFSDDTNIFGDNNLLRDLVENSKQDGSDLAARLTDLFMCSAHQNLTGEQHLMTR